MSTALERRLEKLEVAASPVLFCFIFPGETLNDVLQRYGIAPERADEMHWIRWRNPGEGDE